MNGGCVIGGGIGELLTVEQIVSVGKNCVHADRARQLHLTPFVLAILRNKAGVQVQGRVAVLEGVDANVDAIGSSRGSESKVHTLVAANVSGVAKAIAPVAYPYASILLERSPQSRVDPVFLS